MKSSIDFDQVIQNHSHWKYLLKQAIAQGQSEHTVIIVLLVNGFTHLLEKLYPIT